MKLWDSVQKTDPANTKKVNQRGGFTSICAHSQVMAATRQFGPIGVGWGFVTGEPIFQATAIIIPITIWHGDRSNTYGPMYGCAEMTGKRLDTDAPKKATTDGLTKALSLLGFNADIFLGMYDDDKYLASVTAEFAPPAEKPKLEMNQRDVDWIAAAKANPASLSTLDSDPTYRDLIKAAAQ